MSRAALLSWLCACALAGDVRAARILVAVPTPSISHQVVFRPLTQELARRGHQVVFLTTDPAFPPGKTPPNLTEIDLHDSYKSWVERFVAAASGNQDDLYNQIYIAHDLMLEIFPQQMRTGDVKRMLEDRTQRFDLVVVEAWTRAALVLGHIFKAPVIQMSSLGAMNEQYEVLGAPLHPFLYPDFLHSRVFNLTLWEKATQLYSRYQIRRLIMSFEEKEDVMLRELFGPETPPLSELKKNIEMLFVNVDPLWDGFRPVPPNVIHLGGLHSQPPKELPQELKSWLDGSRRGVVYISFGTNTDPAQLPAGRVALLARVLAALPRDVLWRWPAAPPDLPPNVRTEAWLPQADLLRHEKIVLFITQAGLQSTDEALRAGVPLLALPMLGDQWYNAEQYEHYGVGLRLDLGTVTELQLRAAIDTLIEDPGYRERSLRLGQEMQDRAEPALARAAWWAERALRRRSSRRAPAALLPWTQFLQLDLVAAIFAVVSLTLAAVIVILMRLYKALFNHKKVKTS